MQVKVFQRSILTTMLEVENTFFQLAGHERGNVLVVCDRGSMDPFACEAGRRLGYIGCKAAARVHGMVWHVCAVELL